MDGDQEALLFEVINRNASAHFIGGIPIGESSDSGAVDPHLRLLLAFIAPRVMRMRRARTTEPTPGT